MAAYAIRFRKADVRRFLVGLRAVRHAGVRAADRRISLLYVEREFACVLSRPCGRILERWRFWDSRGESGMIHRTPTESEAGVNVDKDG